VDSAWCAYRDVACYVSTLFYIFVKIGIMGVIKPHNRYLMSDIFIHKTFQLNGHHFDSPTDFIGYVNNNLPEHSAFIQALFYDDAYITAHTSGSTGTPKSIKIKKAYMCNSAYKTIAFFDLKPQTKALLNLSSDFIAGKMMWVRALLGGWHLDVVPPDHQSIADALSKNRYDFGAMVPLQVFQNIDKIFNIKQLIIGGGQVSQELLGKIYHLPNRIFATYGMTETVTHIAVMPLNRIAENDTHKNDIKGVYQVLENIQISVDDRNCLVISAPEIADNKVITNDLVEIIDAKHFRWLGRYDNIINSGGVKLMPEQIEQKLQKYLNHNFFIAGLPDDKLGEKLVLIVEGQCDTNECLTQCKKVLDKYEIPKEVISVERFVRTESGKIKRKSTLLKISG